METVIQTQNHENNEGEVYKYKSGIPTLRSSSHRVRYSSKKTQKNEPQPKRTTLSNKHNGIDPVTSSSGSSSSSSSSISNSSSVGTMLPASIREAELIPYDMEKYNFIQSIIDFLNSLDSNIVGTFRTTEEAEGQQNDNDDVDHNKNNSENENESNSDSCMNTNMKRQPMLENFEVPISSLTKKSKRGLLLAQDHLSQAMHDCFFGENSRSSSSSSSSNSNNIVTTFDTFVAEFIIPHLKQRLVREEIIDESTKMHFYYQRPPTLRIQPGPARARVNRHKDKDYGHQNGELNFWIPLTNRVDTGVDLHVESEEDKGDYEPLGTDVGSVSSFFGSGCSHFVNENRSGYTRVSLDFRVGIEPFYDPNWSKIGTRDDHLRRCVEM